MRTRKFWIRLAGVLLVLLVLARFVGVALAPGMIDSALREKGFTSEIADIDVSIFAGEFRLRGLVVRELDSEEAPLLSVDHVAVDIDMSSTLTGDPVCHRMELDGLELDLKRTKEHGWNFEALLAGESEPEPDEPDEEPEEQGAYDLSSPIRITSLRAQDMHIFVADELSDPYIETEVTLNMTASDLGTEVGQFELVCDATGILDIARIKGQLSLTATELDQLVGVDVHGFHPKRLNSWLKPLGIEGRADVIDVGAYVSVGAIVSGANSDAIMVTIGTEDWSVVSDGVEAMALDHSSHQIVVGANAVRGSELVGLRARARKNSDGALSVAGLALIGSEGSAEPESEPPVATHSASEPIAWMLDSFQIREGALTLEDVSSNTEVVLQLDSFSLEGVDSEASRVASLDIQLSAPGDFESLHVHGDLTPSAEAVDVAAKFDLDGITLDRCRALLEPLGIEPQFEDASAFGKLSASIERGQLAGALEVSELWLKAGGRKTELGSIRVDRFEVADEIRVNEILIAGMRGAAELHENGDLEIAGIRLSAPAAQPESAATEAAEPAPTNASPSQLVVRLDSLNWSDTQFEFINHAEPDRGLKATGLTFDVRDLALGADSDCSISANVDLNNWCERVSLEGTVKSSRAGDIASAFGFRISGLNGEQLRPFLPPDNGVVPEFQTGEFAVRLATQSRSGDAGLTTSLQVADLGLMLDEQRLLGFSSLAVDDLSFPAEGPRLESVRLDGAELRVRDAVLTLGASLSEFQLGASEPSEFAARIALQNEPTAFDLTGQLTPNLDDLLLTMQIAMTGLNGSSLNPHLPAGTEVAMEQGSFGAQLEARLQTLESGGIAGGVVVSDVRLSEGETPLLALRRVELSAANIDTGADRFELGRVNALGLELDAVREADGALRVAGLRIRPVESEETPQAIAPTEPEEPATEVSWARKYDTEPLPTVLLESLELELAALRFHDLTSPDSKPATFTARFHHAEPLTLLSPEADTLAPLVFALDGSAQPVAESMGLVITLAPWESDARAKLDFSASGIRAAGLTEVLPELSAQLDGSELTDGSFEASVEARLVARRRNPVDFGLRNGFGFEFGLQNLAFRNGEQEKPLASLGGVAVEVERFDLETGAMKIASIEVSDLQAEARLSERGPVALGIALLTPAETGEPETEAPVSEAPAEPYSGPEVQLARLTVSGLDLVITDERTEPATVLPLNALDFDLERFTTKTLTEPNPFRFALYMGAGEMSLPKPHEPNSALSGLAGAALSAVSGSEDEFEYEQRPAFGEIALTGNLSLGPEPRGRVNANIDGFELLGFSGLAKQSGVEIGAGVLDTWARVKLEGPDGIGVRSNIVFTDLSLDEPPDGPISRYLKLPASLDAVLFALKNNDDEHRIPLNFHMDADGIGGSEIARVAVSTLATIITSALASAPLRIGDGVTGLIAVPGMEESPVSWLTNLFTPALRLVGLAAKEGPQSEPVALAYDGGELELGVASSSLLEPLLEEVREREDFIVCIEHEFGAADLLRAEQLANPTPEECRGLAIGLRRRKRELLRTRSECAADLATSYAVGGQDAAKEMLAKLREIEAELGSVELALDETLSMLRPGSERHAARRTRRAMIKIAEARLAVVEAAFAAAMEGDTSMRFEIKRARENASTGEDAACVRVSLKMEPEE